MTPADALRFSGDRVAFVPVDGALVGRDRAGFKYPTFFGGPGTLMVSDYATLAAGIAIAGGLIGTGMAQSGIGAAGMGIIAEKPEKFGNVLFFFVIPETLWIIGFVLGIVLLLGVI